MSNTNINTQQKTGWLAWVWENGQGDIFSPFPFLLLHNNVYLEGKCPVVITVKEESVENRGEGGVPDVDEEGGQELHHGGELEEKEDMKHWCLWHNPSLPGGELGGHSLKTRGTLGLRKKPEIIFASEKILKLLPILSILSDQISDDQLYLWCRIC